MKKALILVVLLMVIFIGEMLMYDKNTHAQDERPFIAVTSFSLYEISTKLLEDKVNVKKLIPFGVEPHAYTPSVKTMTQISKAKLFIYNGLSMEPWITKEYENSLDMSQFVRLNCVEEDEHEEEHEHEGHHHDGENDPHYWLDIENMMTMTSVLCEKFQVEFPEFKETIEKNKQNYINDLKILKLKYEKELKTCKFKEIVVNHNAFGYLAHAYNFETHALTGLSPDEQVSAKKMTEVADFIKKEDVKIIFFESFVSSKIADTLATETGAKVDSLQPLANVTKDEAKKGYILIMQENLTKLSNAMECE